MGVVIGEECSLDGEKDFSNVTEAEMHEKYLGCGKQVSEVSVEP